MRADIPPEIKHEAGLITPEAGVVVKQEAGVVKDELVEDLLNHVHQQVAAEHQQVKVQAPAQEEIAADGAEEESHVEAKLIAVKSEQDDGREKFSRHEHITKVCGGGSQETYPTVGQHTTGKYLPPGTVYAAVNMDWNPDAPRRGGKFGALHSGACSD